MGDYPTGTISFLFTDIEGSTRRWEENADAMSTALGVHDEVLRTAVEGQGGFLFKHTGDGVCVAFAGAAEAVAAAVDAQRGLEGAAWADGMELRARMGIHTGEAALVEGDYFGATVNRVARVMDSGHGGQIILSSTVAGLARDALPEGTSLEDLGDHRLKDLSEPERLYQLDYAEGAESFPALRTLEIYPNNLPTQISSFVGRKSEVEELVKLAAGSRLTTLTGVGGVGKTRLSLQVAAELIDRYADGVWLVELASVADETLIPREVAEALNIKEEAHRTLVDTLRDELAGKELLLVLDNCEHVIDAAAKFAEDMLRHSPGLSMIVTSREGLAVPGEVLWRVPSLSVTDDAGDAIELFAERARQMRRDIKLDDSTREAIRKICVRLDGIPLAIELAAARLKVMRAEQIAERLDDRFRLLTGGSRTALPRQRTLQAMMDWSHDLLAEHEQVLLRRLAVFYGGFTLEAAEEICGDDALPSFEILDLLTHLVEASLVAFDDDTGRYRLLETVRQYGLDKLIAAYEGEPLRRRHLDFYTTLSDQAHSALLSDDADSWLGRYTEESDNFRAALTWSLEAGHASDALRMAAGLGRFFFTKAMLEEALGWYDRALAATREERTVWRARALGWDAGIAVHAGDFDRADRSALEAIAIAEELDDPVLLGQLYVNLGNNAGVRFKLRDALDHQIRARDLARVHEPDYEVVPSVNMVWVTMLLGEQEMVAERLAELKRLAVGGTTPDAWVEMATGWVQMELGDLDAAVGSLERCVAAAERVGNAVVQAVGLSCLGAISIYRHDMATYRTLVSEAEALNREVGSHAAGFFTYRMSMGALAEMREWDEYVRTARRVVAFVKQINTPLMIAFMGSTLGSFAVHAGLSETAVTLVAAQQAYLDTQRAVRLPREQGLCDLVMAEVSTDLSADTFSAAWEKGLGLDAPGLVGLLEEVVRAAD